MVEGASQSESSKQTPADLGPPRRPVYGPPEAGGALVRLGPQYARLVAARCFGYGEPIAREKPLLHIPADSKRYLLSVGSVAMKEVAKHLGDTSRLAGFLAFMRLPEAERAQVLALGVSPGCKVVEQTRQVMDMFVKDLPQFKDVLDWDLFATVVGILTDRGSRLPSGDSVLYGLCGAAAHSFTPNAVIERRGDGIERELRALSYTGISLDEEVTVSYTPEDALFLPKTERLAALAAVQGRCVSDLDPNTDGVDDAEPLLRVLTCVRNVTPKCGDIQADQREVRLRSLHKDLASVDKSLPFAMVAKARARTNLAAAFEELGGPTLLPVAMTLYDAAVEETEVALGESAHTVAANLRRHVKTLEDQLGA